MKKEVKVHDGAYADVCVAYPDYKIGAQAVHQLPWEHIVRLMQTVTLSPTETYLLRPAS